MTQTKKEKLFEVDGKNMQSRRIALAELFLAWEAHPEHIETWETYPWFGRMKNFIWDQKDEHDWAYNRVIRILKEVLGLKPQDTAKITMFVQRAADAKYRYLDDEGNPSIHQNAWRQYWSNIWWGKPNMPPKDLYEMVGKQLALQKSAAAPEQLNDQDSQQTVSIGADGVANPSSPVPIKVEQGDADLPPSQYPNNSVIDLWDDDALSQGDSSALPAPAPAPSTKPPGGARQCDTQQMAEAVQKNTKQLEIVLIALSSQQHQIEQLTNEVIRLKSLKRPFADDMLESTSKKQKIQ